jgi:hypothetical protein
MHPHSCFPRQHGRKCNHYCSIGDDRAGWIIGHPHLGFDHDRAAARTKCEQTRSWLRPGPGLAGAWPQKPLIDCCCLVIMSKPRARPPHPLQHCGTVFLPGVGGAGDVPNPTSRPLALPP